MPTIEFVGYSEDEQERVEKEVRTRLRDEPYRETCVFVRGPGTRVLDWSGISCPYLRVSTGNQERAERFKQLVADVADLEIVMIDYQGVTPPAPAS